MDRMQGKPEISIIVPVYNVQNYISDCINSVLAQTYTSWELILVDDGSKDASSNICDEYANSNNKIKVIHKDNEGVSTARKNGCEKATGRYVMFVDGDDWIHKDCLLSCVEVLKKNEVDIVHFGSKWVDDITGEEQDTSFKLKGLYRKKEIEKEIFPMLIQTSSASYYPPAIWGNLFKKKAILPYMIADQKAVVGEDSACVIPAIAHADSIYYCDEKLYYYRLNNASVTKARKVFNWDNPEVIAKHLLKTIDISVGDFKEQLYRRLCHDIFNVSLSRFYGKHGYKETSQEIREALMRPMYSEAIDNAHFEGSVKAMLMMLALKHKLTVLMFLFSRVNKK